MLPTFQILGRTISFYGIFSVIGAAAACIVFVIFAPKKGLKSNDSIFVLLCAGVGGVLGAKLFYMFTVLDAIGTDYFTALPFLQKVNYLFGGMVYYGGLIGGALAVIVYALIAKKPVLKILDILAPAMLIFHCFGRIGCLAGGCCYGIESEHGFYFIYSPTAPHDKKMLPVQLYEAFGNLVFFGILMVILIKTKYREGLLVGLYFILYSVMRFILEFYRGDEYRGVWGGISFSQYISFFVFAAGIACLLIAYNIIKKQRKATNPDITPG